MKTIRRAQGLGGQLVGSEGRPHVLILPAGLKPGFLVFGLGVIGRLPVDQVVGEPCNPPLQPGQRRGFLESAPLRPIVFGIDLVRAADGPSRGLGLP